MGRPQAYSSITNKVADFLLLEAAFTALQFLIVSPLIALAHRDDR
jgi:hypothetical protein